MNVLSLRVIICIKACYVFVLSYFFNLLSIFCKNVDVAYDTTLLSAYKSTSLSLFVPLIFLLLFFV
jgi:hypothetical protein